MLIYSHCNNIILFFMFVYLLLCPLQKNTFLPIGYFSIESNSGFNIE